MDHPADQWYGLITHEVAHHFLFDIVPGTATPRWITEGLAEYERGAWDPGDLAALREAVRANAIPQMSGLRRGWRQQKPAFGLRPRARGVRLHRVALGEARRAPVHLLASPDRQQRGGSVRTSLQVSTDRVRSGLRTVRKRAVCSICRPIARREVRLSRNHPDRRRHHRDQFPRVGRARLHRTVGGDRGRDQTKMGRGVWRRNGARCPAGIETRRSRDRHWPARTHTGRTENGHAKSRAAI